jgi:NACalpha-BTF3-like transcription factor
MGWAKRIMGVTQVMSPADNGEWVVERAERTTESASGQRECERTTESASGRRRAESASGEWGVRSAHRAAKKGQCVAGGTVR